MNYKTLWKEHKVKFFLLLPVIILLLLKDIIFDMLISGGLKEVKETEEKDMILKDKADKANLEAEKHKATADRIKKEIDNIEENENWHEK